MVTETIFPKKADRAAIYQYKVDVIVGEGGTGTVYRGLDPKSGTLVAVKFFRANFFRNALHQKDLARAVKKFAKLDHPNVVKIYEFLSGKEGDALVLEYIDGPDLRWYLNNRPFILNERLVIAAQICNGLGYLHEQGFIHHDLKPGNVLFTRKGQAKLCDFSLTGTNRLLNLLDGRGMEQFTPMYVCPEVIRKEKATPLSDLYSLGAMLYLMFGLKAPFDSDNLQHLYMSHLQVVPVNPSLINKECPRPLGDIIMKLLEKKPERRYTDCQQLRIALSDIGKSRI